MRVPGGRHRRGSSPMSIARPEHHGTPVIVAREFSNRAIAVRMGPSENSVTTRPPRSTRFLRRHVCWTTPGRPDRRRTHLVGRPPSAAARRRAAPRSSMPLGLRSATCRPRPSSTPGDRRAPPEHSGIPGWGLVAVALFFLKGTVDLCKGARPLRAFLESKGVAF